jgi:AcrR family transcriptional regulator
VSARRDEIVALARKLFAEQGYVSTSMRDIAEASGLLPGSLYTHFASKAKLVGEIVSSFYAELLAVQKQAMAEPGTGAERLRIMFREIYAICEQHPEELTILHYDWKSLSALEETSEVRTLGVRTLDMWRKVLKAGIADGTLTSAISPELATRLITSAIHGALDPVRYRDLPSGKKANVAQQLEDVLLGGLLAR